MDEGDPTRVGLHWLMALGQVHHADRLDTMVSKGSGGIASVYCTHALIGYFVLLRDPLDWTQLICHGLTKDTSAPRTEAPFKRRPHDPTDNPEPTLSTHP